MFLDINMIQQTLSQMGVRLDSSSSAVLMNQLKDYKQIYEKEFKGYKCRGLFPVTSRGTNMEFVATPRFEASSAYLISGSNPVNIPTIDGVLDEVVNKVRVITSSTVVGLLEAARNVSTANNTVTKKLGKLRETFEDAVEDTTLKGKADKGIEGLFDKLAVTGQEAVWEYEVPANGTSASKKFKDKTVDKIVEQMLAFIDYAKNNGINNDKFKPVIICVTPDVKTLFDSKPWTANASMNITQYLQSMRNVTITDHGDNKAVAQLGGEDIMWGHTGNDSHIELIIPQEFSILQPQLVALSNYYYAQGQIAGVQIAEPKAVIFAKGIS